MATALCHRDGQQRQETAAEQQCRVDGNSNASCGSSIAAAVAMQQAMASVSGRAFQQVLLEQQHQDKPNNQQW